MIKMEKTKITKRFDQELLVVEAWGRNGIRVRAFADRKYDNNDYALENKKSFDEDAVYTKQVEESYELVNGKIRAVLDHRDRLIFYNEKNEVILKEFIRLRAVKRDDGSEDMGNVEITNDFNSTLKLKSREFRPNAGGDFTVTTRFESAPKEKIFGMGQYQQTFLDLKNTTLELAPRNSQVSIPFYLSSLNYGFLWNNPGIGQVNFAKNVTEWKMHATNRIDYWVTAGDSPKQIEEQYTSVTGRVPEMPEDLLGLWQSKLRYLTQEELIEIGKEYTKRGIQLSTLVIDFFHWEKQGEYSFDKKYWPDPQAMVDDLAVLGIKVVVSVWPTVQDDASNYDDFLENGYLVNVNRGVRITMQTQGNTVFADMTNREAREYIWKRLKENYGSCGIDHYWLDVAEPGYAVYDFDNFRYDAGTDLQCGNIYANSYLKMIYYGLKDTGKRDIVTLVRSAWAGGQKYGALLWSGDIDASFEAFNNQVNTGLNVGIAGIPWWTTDIGGFHGGSPEDPQFRELMIRWFQYATFSPILRMHGFRVPYSEPLASEGGGAMVSGAPNEIWSYGKEAEEIFMKFIKVREKLKGYLKKVLAEANQNGSPIMRPLFYEFPEDALSWEDHTENSYMFGERLLVAPIMNYLERQREVYLPANQTWVNLNDGKLYEGGKVHVVEADLAIIPIFAKAEDAEEFADLLNC